MENAIGNRSRQFGWQMPRLQVCYAHVKAYAKGEGEDKKRAGVPLGAPAKLPVLEEGDRTATLMRDRVRTLTSAFVQPPSIRSVDPQHWRCPFRVARGRRGHVAIALCTTTPTNSATAFANSPRGLRGSDRWSGRQGADPRSKLGQRLDGTLELYLDLAGQHFAGMTVE